MPISQYCAWVKEAMQISNPAMTRTGFGCTPSYFRAIASRFVGSHNPVPDRGGDVAQALDARDRRGLALSERAARAAPRMRSAARRDPRVTQPLSIPGSRGSAARFSAFSRYGRLSGLFVAADRCEHQGGGTEKNHGGGFRNLRRQELGHQAFCTGVSAGVVRSIHIV